MAKVEPSDFMDRDTSLVFLARNTAEAERVEELLTEQGIDFTVALERYVSGLMPFFSSERSGIGFYVLCGQAGFCRNLLRVGFKAGVVDDPDAYQ